MDQAALKRLKRISRGRRRYGQRTTIEYHGEVTGLRSGSGRAYVAITESQTSDGQHPPTLFPIDQLADESALFQRLSSDNRHFPSPEQRISLVRKALNVTNLTSAHVVEHTGYTDSLFAFRNGDLIGAKKSSPEADADDTTDERIEPLIAFDRDRSRARVSGKRKRGNAALQPFLQGQDILVFAAAVAIAPLILPFSRLRDANFGFQIVGPPACGKSTTLKLAASMWGCPYVGREVTDVEYFSYLRLDERLELCNDQPLILDDLDRWFALETPREKLERVRAFDQAFHHRTKTHGGSVSYPTRLIVLMAGREPLEDLCGDDEAARQRLGERLLTIPVPVDRPGKLVVGPDAAQFPSPARYIGSLNVQLNRSFGHGARRMVRKVLERAATNEAAFQADVDKRIDEFVAKAGVDESDGPAFLAASRFGLVYAAAQLGRAFGALPRLLVTEDAILAVYNMHRGRPGGQSFEERLKALLQDERLIDLGPGKLPKITEERRRNALGSIRQCATHVEIHVPPANTGKLFPGMGRPEKDRGARPFLMYEEEDRKGGKHRHWKMKRKPGKGCPEERVYVFRLLLPDPDND